MAQALLVVVEALPAHLNFQEPLLVAVAVPLIFPRAAQVFHPGKTLQEVLLLLCPTHLDLLSHLVGAQLHHHSLQDPGQAMPLYHQAFRQEGTDLSLRHQEAPHQALDQASLPLLHPQTAVDLPYLLLQEGGPHFLMTDRRRHPPLWEVTGHPCRVTCPLLPLHSTPNLLPLLLLHHPLVPHLVGAHLLFHQDVQDLLPYLPPQQEAMTPHLVFPKETARSTAIVQHHHLAGQDLSLLHQMRDRHLLEGTSRQYAQALFLLQLLQVDLWHGQAQSPLVGALGVGLPFLPRGQGQEVGFLHRHRWGMVSKTTTRYKMSGRVGSLFTQCQTFLHLSPMCPSRRPTPVRLSRLRAKDLVKRKEELLPFLLYPGEDKMATITTLGTTPFVCLPAIFVFHCYAHCALTCSVWFM